MFRQEFEKFVCSNPLSLCPEYYFSHAASAFCPTPFSSAAILSLDGVGEWVTYTIGVDRVNGIEIPREISFPRYLDMLYSAFTAYCGFEVNNGEYKFMVEDLKHTYLNAKRHSIVCQLVDYTGILNYKFKYAFWALCPD